MKKKDASASPQDNTSPAKSRQIMRRRAVEEYTGLPTSTLYDQIAKGLFPKPIKIGKRAVGWLRDEIDARTEKQIAQRDSAEVKQ